MSEEKTEIKVKEMIKDLLNNKENLFFQLQFDGQVYASNKNHKYARGMVIFPHEICKDDLRCLRDWFMLIIAIPKEKAFEYIQEKIKEKKEGNNDGKD